MCCEGWEWDRRETTGLGEGLNKFWTLRNGVEDVGLGFGT